MGLERNDNFYFLSFSFFSTLFWPQKKRQRYFIVFWIFFTIFLEFSITLRVRTKQNDNFYFLSFSALSNLFWLEMTPYWFYDNFLTFFAISLQFSITCREGTERNGTIILIFSLSLTFPAYVGLKWSHNGIFEFSEFFCYFFGILYYGCAWNGTEQKFLFSLVLDLFHPILSSKEAIIVFFNFLNIFAIYFEFCITDGIGTERNDNFYFLSFSFFSTLFWLQKKPQRYFIIFWFFFAIFLEFSITFRVKTKQNDNFYFLSFSALTNLFWLGMTPYWFYDNFLTFFSIFMEFSITLRVRTK